MGQKMYMVISKQPLQGNIFRLKIKEFPKIHEFSINSRGQGVNVFNILILTPPPDPPHPPMGGVEGQSLSPTPLKHFGPLKGRGGG